MATSLTLSWEQMWRFLSESPPDVMESALEQLNLPEWTKVLSDKTLKEVLTSAPQAVRQLSVQGSSYSGNNDFVLGLLTKKDLDIIERLAERVTPSGRAMFMAVQIAKLQKERECQMYLLTSQQG